MGDEHLGNAVFLAFGNPFGVAVEAKHITDDELVHLKCFTKLEQLYFWHVPITDAGLAHLKGLTNLAVLDLSNTEITDAGWCN